ncbi:hypothetical protein PTNB73_01310 [Pyrenophora teres f. teres]|nr:hypothetical protein HRS9139_02562 [Pyrenophora teres f. teres]KAE8849679.1 hypothetical protein PTNB85_00095 [Pyrenophora teres f. teres]KAE8852294.1 hypothetical protein HRS9122_02581 [Pyrenophora teres f. teres]KAE8870965.1 hypothetical protein PTNB29_01309 [Pyrenophora teres f. teres]KAE8874678.1 hypothetical protein PTNB73_01310 [Pyrenophora teres f. teres]
MEEEEDTVWGEGCISDDSSFYGDEEEQKRQVRLAKSFKPEAFWRAHGNHLNTIAYAARAKLAVKETTAAPEQASPATDNAQSVVEKSEFNISGIDRKAMEQGRLARLGEKRKREPEPEPEVQLFNPLEGQPDAWQLGEPIDDFIKRLPPVSTPISKCPWIWAANPHRDPCDKSPSPREDDFITRGIQLLAQSMETRQKIKDDGAKGPRAMVNRQLTQESKALQERITCLARETRVVSGKWMLFLKLEDVTRVWKQVVTSVIDNRLGRSCKVATDDGKNERLICVYTKDFEDAEDVLRVLKRLDSMGLIQAGKSIYYKPDAYTYLDITGEKASEYDLRASLYNSRSLLADGKDSKSASLPQKKQSMLDRFF